VRGDSTQLVDIDASFSLMLLFDQPARRGAACGMDGDHRFHAA
jgi:hypothetical protein